jgi:O-antigen/teichoic acid export membrane protein
MNGINRTAVNMVANASGFVAPLLVNFITTPILLRLLGEDGYGLQSLVLVISGYLVMMDLGMDVPITKLLAQDHAQGHRLLANRLLSTTLLLYLMIGLGGFFVIYLSRDFLVDRVFAIPAHQKGGARLVFQLAAVGFTLNLLCSWGRACLAGIQRYDVANTIRILTLVTGSIVGVSLVYVGYGVVGFVLVRVVTYGLSAVALVFAVKHLIPYFRIALTLDINTLRRVKSYVTMGILLRVTGFVTAGLDRTLIGMWLGVATVAVYSIQWSIISSALGLMNSIFAFLFPMSSELHASGKSEQLRQIFKKIAKFSAAAALLVFSLLLVYGDIFLRLWVGESVAMQTRHILRLLVLSSLVGHITVGLVNEIAVGTGRVRAFSVYNIIRGITLAGGLLIFINWFGLIGAGLGFLLANVVDMGFFLFVLRYYLKMSFRELFNYSYICPIIMGVVLCVVGLLFKPYVNTWLSLIASVGLLIAAYIIVGFAIGVYGETERAILLHFRGILLKPFRGGIETDTGF